MAPTNNATHTMTNTALLEFKKVKEDLVAPLKKGEVLKGADGSKASRVRCSGITGLVMLE